MPLRTASVPRVSHPSHSSRAAGGLRRVREDGGDEHAVRRLVLFLLRVPLVEALEAAAGCARWSVGSRGSAQKPTSSSGVAIRELRRRTQAQLAGWHACSCCMSLGNPCANLRPLLATRVALTSMSFTTSVPEYSTH